MLIYYLYNCLSQWVYWTNLLEIEFIFSTDQVIATKYKDNINITMYKQTAKNVTLDRSEIIDFQFQLK